MRTRATLAAQADVMASVRAQAVGTGAGAQRIGWAVVWVQAGGTGVAEGIAEAQRDTCWWVMAMDNHLRAVVYVLACMIR